MTTRTNENEAGRQVAEFKDPWTGRGSLDELVAELRRQQETKLDFVCDVRQLLLGIHDDAEPGKEREALTMFARPGSGMASELVPDGGLRVKDQALQQMGDRSGPNIPWTYLQRLRDERPLTAVDLLNQTHFDMQSRRFIRCLDGKVRAVLSDRYRVIDNYDIAFSALQVAHQHGGEVIEAALSDKRMRIKFTSRDVWDVINETRRDPNSGNWYAGGLGNQKHLSAVSARTRGELPGGPGTVHPLVTVRNSETGHGGFGVRVGILKGICFNLATVEDVVTQVHLGGSLEPGLFSAEAIEADTKAIMLKARDAVAGAFKLDVFRKLVARVRASQDATIEDASHAAENVVKHTAVLEGELDSLLAYFHRDYDATAFGMAQAVSRLAQDTVDAEHAADLEDAAGEIMLRPAMVAAV